MPRHQENQCTLSTRWQASQTVVESSLRTPCVAGQFIAAIRAIWVAVALLGFFDTFVCGVQTGKIPGYTVLLKTQKKHIVTYCIRTLEFSLQKMYSV